MKATFIHIGVLCGLVAVFLQGPVWAGEPKGQGPLVLEAAPDSDSGRLTVKERRDKERLGETWQIKDGETLPAEYEDEAGTDGVHDFAPRGKGVIRIDTRLVVVNASVLDSMGRVITGLSPRHFSLKDAGKPNEITHFAQVEAPLSLGVVLDISGSMEWKMGAAREAVAKFLGTSNKEDEFFLVGFSSRPVLYQSMTRDLESLKARGMFLESEGMTSLYDAVHMAGQYMDESAQNPRKVLLIISDGIDNHSRHTRRTIKKMLQEMDIQVYAIGLHAHETYAPATPSIAMQGQGVPFSESLKGQEDLRIISEATGGRAFALDNIKDLPATAERISSEIRNQFVIGFTPTKLSPKEQSRMSKTGNGILRKLKLVLKKIPGLPFTKLYYNNTYHYSE